MIFKVKVTTVFNCTLERAFKTPMLCDITKVHTGYYGIMPKVTHTKDDADWGRPNSTKKVFTAKSLIQQSGFASEDKVIERKENEYWKIQVYNFQSWMMGFHKFIAEWKTTQLEPQKILVEYTYLLHANVPLFYPLNYIFAKTFFKSYMNQVIGNIKEMANNKEAYLHS